MEPSKLEIECLERSNAEYRAAFQTLDTGGCYTRAKKLKDELGKFRDDLQLVLITSKEGTLTHESDALWKYHVVVLAKSGEWIFDPSYSGAKPVKKSRYSRLYLESGIRFETIN